MKYYQTFSPGPFNSPLQTTDDALRTNWLDGILMRTRSQFLIPLPKFRRALHTGLHHRSVELHTSVTAHVTFYPQPNHLLRVTKVQLLVPRAATLILQRKIALICQSVSAVDSVNGALNGGKKIAITVEELLTITSNGVMW